MPDALDDILRIVNLSFAVFVLLWLLTRRFSHPEKYARGGLRRDIWVMAFLWDLALIVETVEQEFDTGTYLQVGVAMAAVLTTLAILIRPRDDWPDPDWKDKEESR